MHLRLWKVQFKFANDSPLMLNSLLGRMLNSNAIIANSQILRSEKQYLYETIAMCQQRRFWMHFCLIWLLLKYSSFQIIYLAEHMFKKNLKTFIKEMLLGQVSMMDRISLKHVRGITFPSQFHTKNAKLVLKFFHILYCSFIG